MSLKAELQTWSDALDAYAREDYDTSLTLFASIAESSRINFNIGIIYATLGAHEQAVASFAEAFALDQYLAVAYFQSGVSHFLLTRYEEALKDFEDAFIYLRGNVKIDYEQLGLKYQLYSCEILFNRGLCLLNMSRENEGMQDLELARSEKQTEVHDVIDEAIADRGAGYTVFSIPVGVLYRPAEAKLKNLKPKNYLGSAKLIAAADEKDAFIGFTGRTLAELDGTLPPRRGPSSTGPNRELERTALIGRGRTGSSSSVQQGPLRRRPSDMTAALTLPSSTNSSPRQGSPTKPARPPASSRYDPTLPPVSTAPLSYAGKRPTAAPPLPNGIVPLLTPPQSRQGSRSALSDYEEVNELYDSYTSGGLATFERPIEDQDLRAPTGQPKKRVEEWARTAPVGAPLTASPDQYDNGSRRSESIADTRQTSSSHMNRIRLKLHYNQSVRGMSISPELPRADFVDLVLNKFFVKSAALHFVDEDGSQIDIIDDSDWDSAIDAARELGGGRAEGKLSIWVR